MKLIYFRTFFKSPMARMRV